jgi:ABC-type Mn2+/Zn2+ transport system permease subunit
MDLLKPFTEPFMQDAFLASVLVGLTCASLGVYVVQRQMAFIGDAMAHAALPGLAVAHIGGFSLLIGGLVADLLTALGIGIIAKKRAIREDTAIGILFTGMFALGILILNRSNKPPELTHLLFGNILGVTTPDLIFIAVVAVAVLAVLFLLHKEMELASFDPEYASLIGLSPSLLRMVLLVLLAFTVMSCIYLVGVILTSAMLVTPAATASLLTRRLVPMMVVSSAIAVFTGIAGLYISYTAGTSPGATIVTLGALLFVLTYAFKLITGQVKTAEA